MEGQVNTLGSLDRQGCPPIKYFLNGPVSSTAELGAEFFFTETLKIQTEPKSIQNVGVYDFELRSCIDIGPNSVRKCEMTVF